MGRPYLRSQDFGRETFKLICLIKHYRFSPHKPHILKPYITWTLYLMVFRNPILLTPQRVTKTSNLPHRRKVNRRKRELNHSIQSSPTNKKLQLRKNQRKKKSLLLKKNQLLKVKPNSHNVHFFTDPWNFSILIRIWGFEPIRQRASIEIAFSLVSTLRAVLIGHSARIQTFDFFGSSALEHTPKIVYPFGNFEPS